MSREVEEEVWFLSSPIPKRTTIEDVNGRQLFVEKNSSSISFITGAQHMKDVVNAIATNSRSSDFPLLFGRPLHSPDYPSGQRNTLHHTGTRLNEFLQQSHAVPKMKVLATEDVKVVTVEDKSPAEGTSRSAFSQEYECKPEPRNYVNFSKLVLLSLAIIASFLLCLIFARDLWGQKGEKEKHEVVHPQRQTHRAIEAPSHFPFMDDLLENLQDLPFGKESHGKSDEEDPKVVSKITKISFRILPSDSSEPLAHNQIEKSKPPVLDDPVEEMMKMMMSMMDDIQPHQSSHMVERPSLFGDLPIFNHQPNSAPHPKLIIVRKLNPSMTQAPKEDDFFSNILDGLFNQPKISNQQHDDPFSLFPLQPIHHQKSDPIDTAIEKVFPFLKHIIVKPKPAAPVQISHTKPTTVKPNESPESWKEYKNLISDLADSVDTLLDDTASLKDLVKNAVSKMEAAPAQTENPDTSEGDVASKEQSTLSPPQAPSAVLEFLKGAEELLNRISSALTDASSQIKTEDAALDLVTRTDREGLNLAISSFIKTVHTPLDEVYDASTKLTKTNGNEKEIPEEIYSGIVKLGKGLIHFGKLIYEKMPELRNSVNHVEPTKTVVESKPVDTKPSSIEEMPSPIVSRRIVFFNGNPISDNEKTLNI
ncbi:hypothetical protein GE061_004836 [Apolygus lucorum]|uniref:Uncharacterized protein n=1 Tax=Apolygus lucorum TaxID=248454 RepID=A0A8S9X0D5_APOLU|nr:hypothetical protein GE061_004836 [Apolygus lucorum]